MTKQNEQLFLFAGETSGDIYGAKLMAVLKEKHPHLHLFGVGGPRMRSLGLETLLPMEKFQVMGFIDVFFSFFSLLRSFLFLRSFLLKREPKAVFFIDYPGFNLALATALFKRAYPGKIFHYICPSVWAWGKKRIFKMENILDGLFVLFPFEKELFNPKKLSVHYVGHPLVRTVYENTEEPLNAPEGKRVIALFPGSRKKELFRNFPLQLQVAKKLLEVSSDLSFYVSISEPSFTPLLKKMVPFSLEKHLFFLEASYNYRLMKKAVLSLAKSGTNNLELALHGVPTVVTYGISKLDLFLAKHIFKINLPYYCIVNIIAGEKIFPECIGPSCTESHVFKEARNLLLNEKEREECREKCQKMSKILGSRVPEEEIVSILNTLMDV